MQNITRITRNFGIELANGETWQLVSTSETTEWLDKLCVIMGLNEHIGVDSHIIKFSKNIHTEYDIIKNLNGVQVLNKGPLRIYKCQNASNMICETGGMDSPEVELLKMAQSVFPVYMSILYQGGLPLHAALIEREGIGIAIAAPGGTGKSTCARRIPRPWRAMCDDETLIVRNKNDSYHSHPFPTWSRCNTQEPEETWNVQTHVPISAIFFLKKSQKDEANFLSLSQSALLIYKLSLPVFYRFSQSIGQDEYITIKKLIFENACDIAKNIPTFILEASLDGRFWEAIDRALSINTKEGCAGARISSDAY